MDHEESENRSLETIKIILKALSHILLEKKANISLIIIIEASRPSFSDSSWPS